MRRGKTRMLAAVAAAFLLIGGAIGVVVAVVGAPPVSASTSTTYNILGGNDGHVVGTATVTNSATNGTVTITLAPKSGLTFTGGFVCIGENSSSNTSASYFSPGTGFTARVNSSKGSAKGCPPSTGASYFVAQKFTGGGPWVVSGVPASFFSNGMFLQIHVVVSNGNTGYPCATTGQDYYGNCSDPGGSTQLPVGTMGGIGAAVLAGGGLLVVQRRRERERRVTTAGR